MATLIEHCPFYLCLKSFYFYWVLQHLMIIQFKRLHKKCFVLLWSNFMLLWCQAAMDFVMEEDLKAHLTCWYIQKYVKENPHPQCFIHSSQWPCYCCDRWRKEKSLPGDKQCVATCFVITAQHSTQDFPEIDKHANKLFQGWKIL